MQPDAGTIRLFGEARALPSREASSRLGLETAFQEIPLVPDLSVQANLLLPRHPMRFGIFHDWRASRRKVEEIQAALEIEDIAPDALVRDLDLSQRQKVEIASAISRKPRILILDEPTASLSLNDVEWLGRRIRALEAVGTTIILVTHRMQEVRDFCGRLSVLRNGAHVGSLAVGEASDAEVFRLIMGRAVDVTFPPRPAPTSQGRPLLGARAIEVGSRLRGVSLDLSAGEVVGIAGLQGMGQLALFNALFGAEPVTRGTLSIEGREVAIRSPRDAIRLGVGLVPEDRKIQGLALRLSGSANASLPIVERVLSSGAGRRGSRTVDGRYRVRGRQPASAGALPGRRFVQRRQPAEDRAGQVAPDPVPRAPRLRPDARRRCRYEARDLWAAARFRRPRAAPCCSIPPNFPS